MHNVDSETAPAILATTTPGLEDIALRECLELTGRRGWLEHRGMIGMPGGEDEVCRLNIFSQSLYRVYLVIARGPVGGLEDIHSICHEARYGVLMRTDQSLAVRSERHGEHDFTSQDVGRVAGAGIIESMQAEKHARPPVNLNEPDVIFRAEVRDNHFWLGLDTTGERGLGDRPYRVYRHRASLKPPIAYSLVRLSGWTPEESLLDPMCGSATVLIEAARYARRASNDRPFAFQRLPWHSPERLEAARERFAGRVQPYDAGGVAQEPVEATGGSGPEAPSGGQCSCKPRLRGYDNSEKHVEGARGNLEAAGVDAEVSIADARTAPLNCDRMVVNLPYGVRMGSPSKVKRLYAEFGRNLEQWPWKRLVAITARPKMLRETMPFDPIVDTEVFNGALYTHALVFERNHHTGQ